MKPDFEELVKQYHQLVMSLIQRYYGGRLKGHAEDLSQEIWIKLWEQFKKNENNIVNFKSYLYRTVQTTMWDAIRSSKLNAPEDSLEDSDEPGQSGGEDLTQGRLALEKMLNGLKREEAQMVRAYLKGFTNGEIAALLGISEGRVRNLLSRIKKKLASYAAMGGRL